ncbi:MAG: glycosyltransferase family 2 protein [Phycisphaerales bacterium]|nr:glycosyltransferase family 2 protein [Phycisphaerales bacterium]
MSTPEQTIQRPISVIVPTYKEAGSLPTLLDRLAALRSRTGSAALEVLIVDDDSGDGTVELIAERGESWVRLIVRTEDRGLSPAVLRGLEEAQHDVFVVMDADGSHPADAIPELDRALREGAEFALGSRYIAGGSTEDGWGVLRWINSKIATWMALPFTRALDPMSGFFAIERSTWQRGERIDPIGYKIGLELIVKCRCRSVVEVPIHFSTRAYGESKLTLKVQWQYLVHIVRLARFKFPRLSSFIPFAMVGASGMAVYVALLALLDVTMGQSLVTWIRIAIAVLLTMTWNFFWDRRMAFWDARSGSMLAQYFGFIAVCAVPVLLTFFATWYFSDSTDLPVAGMIGSAIGSAAGLVFNWFGNRFLVFKSMH